MAVAVEILFPGATLSQYDQVNEWMGHEPGGTGPEGLLFHWSTEVEDGVRVVDVWEREDQFARFASGQIGPLMIRAGYEGEPEIRTSEVYNILHARSPVGAHR
jgi:hypothetical protein